MKTIHKAYVDLVTISEAARLTGLSAPTIQKAVDAGMLSCVKTPGGRSLVPIEELVEWMTPRKKGGGDEKQSA